MSQARGVEGRNVGRARLERASGRGGSAGTGRGGCECVPCVL
jgi:hypothetical protein